MDTATEYQFTVEPIWPDGTLWWAETTRPGSLHAGMARTAWGAVLDLMVATTEPDPGPFATEQRSGR